MRSRNKFISFLVLFFLAFGFASAQGPVFRVRLFDIDYSDNLQLMWNEASAASYTLNFLVSGGNRSLTIEADSLINQDLTTDATLVQFASLGIATATVPHGGVGWAKLAIDGVNSSSAGPHIQITTTADDYPLFVVLPYTHDLVRIYFDAYEDDVSKSSDVGSNYMISKESDLFSIKYDSGIAQGAAITWNDGIVLDTSGNVTFGGNLLIPSSGTIGCVGDTDLLTLTANTCTVAGTLAATTITGDVSGATGYEGTSVLSTGEGGGTKFLKEDGDGTCSWQTPAGAGDVTAVNSPVDNDFAKFTTATSIEGRSYAEVLADLSGQATSAFSFGAQNVYTTGKIGIGTVPSYPFQISYTQSDSTSNQAALYSVVNLTDSTQSYGQIAHYMVAVRENTVDTFETVAPYHNLQLHTEDKGGGIGSATSGIIGIFNYVKCNNDGGASSHPDIWASHDTVAFGNEGGGGAVDCVPLTITVAGMDVQINQAMSAATYIRGLVLAKSDVGTDGYGAGAKRGSAIYIPDSETTGWQYLLHGHTTGDNCQTMIQSDQDHATDLAYAMKTTTGFWAAGMNIGNWAWEGFSIYGGLNAAPLHALSITSAGVVGMAYYGAGTATFSAAGVLSSSSDERMKKGIRNFTESNLDNLQPIYYKWNKKSGMEDGYEYVGFSAQNVEKTIPEAVGRNKDGMKSLSDRAIIAVLVNSVKELSKRVTELEGN